MESSAQSASTLFMGTVFRFVGGVALLEIDLRL